MRPLSHRAATSRLAFPAVVCTVGVLGNLRLEVDGVDVTPRAPKSRSLVALLAIDAGGVVSSDRLIDELWPELDVDRARRVLWVRIAELRAGLRRAGADEVLISVRPGLSPRRRTRGARQRPVRLAGRRGVAAHRAGGRPAAAADALRVALGLWRGPALG